MSLFYQLADEIDMSVHIYQPGVDYFDGNVRTENDEHFGDTVDCLIFARLYLIVIVIVLYQQSSNPNACFTYLLSGVGSKMGDMKAGINANCVAADWSVFKIVCY
jgi:hypothetical protein